MEMRRSQPRQRSNSSGEINCKKTEHESEIVSPCRRTAWHTPVKVMRCTRQPPTKLSMLSLLSSTML